MAVLITPALICGVRSHGEHGAIARLLTPDHGLLAGYVRGGRSRALRPVLLPGNSVKAEFRARTEEQLAGLAVELDHSRAPLLSEPLPAAAIDWICALTAVALPEGTPYPALYQALDGVLGAVDAAPAARGWGAALVRYELLMLAELGFGLDLGRCAATGGNEDLAFVSPRSAAAVSRAGAAGYEKRLLPLPRFLIEGGSGDWPSIVDGLQLTGFFLERSVLTDWRADTLAARERLVDRLKRAVA
ncbi:DNA repair protein RecO [Sphingomonadales bacterium 56]|uniref:DNA repair protein RecO n=1 Tax=unclassified Sphingobium TaxID=2611147 RepID=UPI00191891A2|nr:MULTISPECIES: DNA repair protein RecO [unclassified Sphingobium]MBY2927204.1 DNA repair protein RecO [Sphingomonadales bacterium 56]MBY2957272.1 DNA repair protein RecO [Sphingomonadales bacterium 58]CAD7334715.1 DNA repair protein RecO [Sphingobium sp. S8]CAD7334734.1 DNA repair protein RecO [Sphingobium sp. S6]